MDKFENVLESRWTIGDQPTKICGNYANGTRFNITIPSDLVVELLALQNALYDRAQKIRETRNQLAGMENALRSLFPSAP